MTYGFLHEDNRLPDKDLPLGCTIELCADGQNPMAGYRMKIQIGV